MAPEVISSSSDKAKLFASNLKLDDKGYPLPDFPHFTELNLRSIFIKAQEVSKLIKSLDSKMATGPDKIPVFVLKTTQSYPQS